MKKDFWDHFDDMFASMDKMMSKIPKMASVSQKTSGFNSSSTSTIYQDGAEIKVVTKNGKTRVTVNGKEYVPASK